MLLLSKKIIVGVGCVVNACRNTCLDGGVLNQRCRRFIGEPRPSSSFHNTVVLVVPGGVATQRCGVRYILGRKPTRAQPTGHWMRGTRLHPCTPDRHRTHVSQSCHSPHRAMDQARCDMLVHAPMAKVYTTH